MPSVNTHTIDKPTCLSLRRAKATNYTSESHSVLRKLRHFTPWEPHLLSFLFNIPPPGVSWSSFLPLPLRVPCQSLSSDAFFWLPQGMTYPFPLSHFYVFFYWSLARSAPQFLICDSFWPVDLKNFPEARIYKCLHFADRCGVHSLGFGSIQ